MTSLDGTSEETYRLIVKRGTVEDPKGLRVTPGDGQLTVHWDASDSATAPNFYQARWRKAGETAWLNPATHAGDKMSHSLTAPLGTAADGGPRTFASQGSRTVSGLDNGTAYEVQVRAIRLVLEPADGVIDWLASDWKSLTATPRRAAHRAGDHADPPDAPLRRHRRLELQPSPAWPKATPPTT